MSALEAIGTSPTVFGITEPRIWTPPLRALTPDTSVGFDQIEFARDVLGRPCYPWQEWLLIHAGELLPDGRPRFRIVVVLVARQNGKTETLVILSSFWQFVDQVPMILGTSTKVEYAKESWIKSVKLVEGTPALDDERSRKRWTRETNGEQESWTKSGSRYKIAASNAEGGRSLTIDRLILDELRQHHDYSAWGASVYATNAVPDAQIWCLSNAGDDNSVVLNELRESCIEFINTGDGDPRVGLFEWSAPANADPLDINALAQANPLLGYKVHADDLLGDAKRAVKKGGKQLAVFKTEGMCIRVPMLDSAIDPDAWNACMVHGDLSGLRDRVALCLDVAPDQQHATLVAAAVMNDDRVRIEVVNSWDGVDAVRNMLRALPGDAAKVKPRALGWIPNGPAASATTSLSKKANVKGWPPPGVKVEEIRGEVSAVCMGFAKEITSKQVVHADDPLLNDQVTSVSKLFKGDTWVFSRKGEGHCDAAYAAAGAVHIARMLPKPIGKPRVVTADP